MNRDFEELIQNWEYIWIDHPLYSDDLNIVKKYLNDYPDELNMREEIEQNINISAAWDEPGTINHITPIMYACMEGRCDIFDFYLEEGADLYVRDDYGNTLLHQICDFYDPNNRYIIQKLLSRDNNSMGLQQNNEGNIPLQIYLARDDYFLKLETIYLLLPVSDPNLKNNRGENSLMIACKSRKKEIMNFCLDVTNNINEHDNEGNTALHHLYRRYPRTIEAKMLIDKGADISITNNKGQTYLEVN